ncbi:Uma2 family endonuclease [Anoxybacillus geothermalis]|nr:hypothetical protein GARCT_01721 [Geobacillus sp. 12AMOR1]MED0655496.1 Uma2 family endonuclease [Anoxybacillus geothermalis]
MTTPEFSNHNYTYEDYLKWDGQWELIDGVPYSMAPSPSFAHQYMVGELYAALRDDFQQQRCVVVMAPFDVIFASSLDDKSAKNVVQPDISVICNREKITEKGCVGAPDLIVEVLSPSTALKDRNEKYKLYQRFEVNILNSTANAAGRRSFFSCGFFAFLRRRSRFPAVFFCCCAAGTPGNPRFLFMKGGEGR